MGLFPDEKRQKLNNQLALGFQQSLLSKEGKEAEKYLKDRKITDKLIEDFRIGYCPKAVKLPGILEYMSGRVMFPIIDEFENVVAFSGRKPTSEKGAWFHEKFSKSFFPYGLNLAWKNIVRTNMVIVVEGQIDVISMWRHGFHNTVGVLGGALTEEAVSKLARFTNRFITIFDADKAGRESAIRANNLLKDYECCGYSHLDVFLNYNGDLYDPDDFLKNYGTSAMVKAIKRVSQQKKQKKKEREIEEILLCQKEK